MTLFIKDGNTFSITADANLNIHHTLPGGTYVVGRRQTGEYYLTQTEDFKRPKKTYGDYGTVIDRVYNTFNDRPATTGVMLVGEKGSGKSLTARGISIRGLEDQIPTLLVNNGFCGDGFNQLIKNIDQPAVVIFDEFEKVYDSDDQELILSLLDGMVESKKLFVFTCNNKWRVDSHMRNRPGRIYYMLEYRGLEPDFIREYCQDNLLNKGHIDRVVAISGLFMSFNFDQLKALVEEMNRYGETPDQALKMLNVKPELEASSESDFAVQITNLVEGKVASHCDDISLNPLDDRSSIYYRMDGDRYSDGVTIDVEPGDIKKIDPFNGVYIYQKGDIEVKLTRKVNRAFDYLSAF